MSNNDTPSPENIEKSRQEEARQLVELGTDAHTKGKKELSAAERVLTKLLPLKGKLNAGLEQQAEEALVQIQNAQYRIDTAYLRIGGLMEDTRNKKNRAAITAAAGRINELRDANNDIQKYTKQYSENALRYEQQYKKYYANAYQAAYETVYEKYTSSHVNYTEDEARRASEQQAAIQARETAEATMRESGYSLQQNAVKSLEQKAHDMEMAAIEAEKLIADIPEA